MSIVVKAKKKHYAGNKVVLPFLGVTDIPADGKITIEDDLIAHEFIKSLPTEFTYNEDKDDPNYDEPLESTNDFKPEDIKPQTVKDDIKPQTEETQKLDLDEDDKPNEDDLKQAAIAKQIDDEKEAAEKVLMLASLDEKKHSELTELCKAFPGGEWRGKNKEDLVKYLKAKLA